MNQKIHAIGSFRQIELLADTSGIYPGMLVEATATGCQKHGTSVGFAERMFAQEDALQGGIVDTAYTVSTPVSIACELPGNLVRGLLLAGYNYTKGTKLFSDGAGRLRPTTGSPTQCIAVIVDAVDLSASGSVDTLTLVRVV